MPYINISFFFSGRDGVHPREGGLRRPQSVPQPQPVPLPVPLPTPRARPRVPDLLACPPAQELLALQVQVLRTLTDGRTDRGWGKEEGRERAGDGGEGRKDGLYYLHIP